MFDDTVRYNREARFADIEIVYIYCASLSRDRK